MTALTVGTPVTSQHKYPEHKGKDLVVLYVQMYKDKAIGYGIGPVGNNPDLHHDAANGWLYYAPEHVTPITTQESTTLTTFTKGDRVEFTEDYDFNIKTGDKGTLVWVSTTGKAADVEMDGGKRTVYAYTHRFKKIEAKAPFTVGDRVTVKGYIYDMANPPMWNGRTGVVTLAGKSSANVKFDDQQDNAYGSGGFEYKYLVPAEAPAPRKAGEFRVGDKVRIKGGSFTDDAWIGVEGIIEELPAYTSGTAKMRLTTSTKPRGFNPRSVGYVARVNANTLELIEEPKPFTYNDIQVGDTIKRTRTYKSGSVETREGTVTTKGHDYFTDGNTILAYQSDYDKDQVTLELVKRPEPVKPEPKLTDGTVKGDQIIVKGQSGVVKVYTRQKNDRWTTLVFAARKTNPPTRGLEWGTAGIDAAVKNGVESTLVKA